MPELSPIKKVIGVSALVLAGGGVGGYLATQHDAPPVAVQSAVRYCANVQGECQPLSAWEMMALKECPAGWHDVPSCSDYGTVEIPTPTPTYSPQIPTPVPSASPTPTPSGLPPILFSMPPQGYVLRLTCEYDKCTGDLGMGADRGPAWTLQGPWRVMVEPVTTP